MAELTLGRYHEDVSLSVPEEVAGRTFRIRQYIEALKEERRKIEGFKRDLPFCMQLLTCAIETFEQQLPAKLSNFMSKDQGMLTFEDRFLSSFVASKGKRIHEHNTCTQRMPQNGFTQTRFLSPAEAYACGEEIISTCTMTTWPDRKTCRADEERNADNSTIIKPTLSSERREGAFMPFLRTKATSSTEVKQIPQIVTVVVSAPTMTEKCIIKTANNIAMTNSSGTDRTLKLDQHAMTINNNRVQNAISCSKCSPSESAHDSNNCRKPRRRWSKDLHHKFLYALQQLGGSQTATPTQIRELMKVDGLTNNEVKSHLQKYRLRAKKIEC